MIHHTELLALGRDYEMHDMRLEDIPIGSESWIDQFEIWQQAKTKYDDALRTHAAELIANSRRYEWLRSKGRLVLAESAHGGDDYALVNLRLLSFPKGRFETLDAAIDAHIEEEGAK